MTANLPKWLTRRKDGVLMIDPDIAYPSVLSRLGFKGKVDKEQAEIAYQCAKLEAQRIANEQDLIPENGTLTIHIMSDEGRKQKWGQANLPGEERRAAAATANRQQHYEKVRGRI